MRRTVIDAVTDLIALLPTVSLSRFESCYAVLGNDCMTVDIHSKFSNGAVIVTSYCLPESTDPDDFSSKNAADLFRCILAGCVRGRTAA